MTLYVTLTPTTDDTLRIFLPNEVRIALSNHTAIFYQGGLVLNVVSSIPLPPVALFQMALLTLLCLDQRDMVPTSTKRPILISYVIAEVTPQDHAPWLRLLLLHSADYSADGFMSLPWLAPSFTSVEDTVSWSSSVDVHAIRHNKTLSFCPGAIIAGTPQLFVVSAGDITSPLCTSLLLSITNPRVFHTAIHTGSSSNKDFGLHTFPKSVF
jgi:hypothetical protein